MTTPTLNSALVGYTPAHPPASGNEFATKFDVNAVATGGTVTNIATAAPITGGPITTTGTIGIDPLAIISRAQVQTLEAFGGF